MMTIDRPSLDVTMLRIARALAVRSTCSRANVGAVIVREGRIISTGYNGAPSKLPHCDHTDDLPFNGCRVAVHAEANAIAFAARHGVSTNDAILYTTLTPCLPCAQLIINAGITSVVAGELYRDLEGWELLSKVNVELVTEESL